MGKYKARFVKGDLPDWIEAPGTLMRATAHIIQSDSQSQVPGYMTVKPVNNSMQGQIVVAKPGDFGLYLGKKHVTQPLRRDRHRSISVPVPTFWFNGRRIVSVTLVSYDDMIVSDDVFDDWRAQYPSRSAREVG